MAASELGSKPPSLAHCHRHRSYIGYDIVLRIAVAARARRRPRSDATRARAIAIAIPARRGAAAARPGHDNSVALGCRYHRKWRSVDLGRLGYI